MRSRKLVVPVVVCAAAFPATAVATPKARFLQRPSSALEDRVTTFDASPSSCDRKPCSYLWRTASTRKRLRRARPVGRREVLRYTFRQPGVRYVRVTVSNRRGRRSSKTRKIAVSSAEAAIALTQVDGGPRYYRRFSNPLPTAASHFPIGVWFESVVSQADVDKDKAVGLNTYVVLTSNSSLRLLASNGMKLLAHQGEWTERAGEAGAGAIAGWELRDEIDMELGPEEGYGELQRIMAGLPVDGRLRYNNYGKGVMFWHSDAEAARFVNAQDVVSADTYWFTDNNICDRWEGGALLNRSTRPLTPAECHRAANYGATVERMRKLVRPRGSKPVWAFVEVGHPFSEEDWPSIAPAEVKAAVWQSLIGGARGVIYFNHSFGGANQTQHALREPAYAEVRSAVQATNRRIKVLARVLNAPTVSSGWSQGAGTTAMVKWAKGHFYVFAGSAGSAVTGQFSLPCVGDANATVLDEGRAIPVRGGLFEDSFADGNAIHIYRIDGGSTCGLAAGAGGSGGGGGA